MPVKESVSCVPENPELTRDSLSSGVPTVAAAHFGDAVLHSFCQEGEGAGRAAITSSAPLSLGQPADDLYASQRSLPSPPPHLSAEVIPCLPFCDK